MFEALVCPISMKELIAQGFLVPYKLRRPNRQLRNDQIAQSPVDAWKEHALGRKTIVFAAHNKAASEFAEQFNAAGVVAATVYDGQPIVERLETLRKFKAGQITVLINCMILTEGFDDREVSCVILGCSIGPKALAKYLQCVGRGLRTAPGTDKVDCMIIDLPGNSYTHGLPDDDREWSLEGEGIKKKAAPVPERFCRTCGVLVVGEVDVCPGCGLAKPELTAPEVLNEKLVPYEAKRREGPERRARTLAKFMDLAEKEGHKPGAPGAKYKAIYGEWPPQEIFALASRFRRSQSSED